MRLKMSLFRISIAVAALATASLVFLPLQGHAESCIECHLHGSIVEDFVGDGGDGGDEELDSIHGDEVETLAGFHGREFESVREELNAGCRKCHGHEQARGELPRAEVCVGCHTRSKAAQGEPEAAFHTEREHWTVGVGDGGDGEDGDANPLQGETKNVSCIDCHKAHRKGSSNIKFLTPAVVDVCKVCHKKSFDSGRISE